MALIERVMGLEEPRLSEHQVVSVIMEYALGKRTGPQAVSMLGLDANAQAEILVLYNYINGGATALEKLLLAFEVEHVLHLASGHLAGYDSPTLVRARLGL